MKDRTNWTIENQVRSDISINFRNQADIDTVQDSFQTIDGHLSVPYNQGLQHPIARRFQYSAVRIRAIGDREYEVGNVRTPTYTGLETRWIQRRSKAVKLGYAIKTFVEYAYQR